MVALASAVIYSSQNIPNHRYIGFQIHKAAYSSEKWSENVLTIKLESKRRDIITKTKKLGGLTATAVFRSFPFKNKIDDIF
jgi:hypothetical protein